MSLRDLFRKNPGGIVAKASAFAEKAHAGQMRKNGNPYFIHVAGTAEILSEWHMDDTTIAAGFLHDTVEDTGVPLGTIKAEFGDEVAFLVDGVTKLGHLKYRGASEKAENMRKMIVALSQDLRVVFIKLADRLNNMRTLDALPPVKQKRIALETNDIYAPLAYRLGMYSVSGELEDIAFSYLFPDEYRWLVSIARERYEERQQYLESIKPEVVTLLKNHDLKPITIDFRAKRYSSLYKKLMKHGMDIEKIHDLVAMRVITRTVPECYAVLGVIHEAWPPVPGRIKDYIALPKPNAYRSLHTTVIGPGEKIVEFQIRTKEMHEESEYGVAAHWLYKEQRKREIPGRELAKEIAWIGQLRRWQERVFGAEADPEKFIEAMKIDFFRDRIFAITPRGEVIDLPQGATPIDFAYHIHSEIGDSATGAKVNGTLVPLDHELTSGDMVEIVMQKGKKPSEDWLRFVKSPAARDHIRLALRGKNAFVEKFLKPTHCELKIVAEHHVGLVKDISTVIANNHMKILSFHTENPKGSTYAIYHAEVQSTDRAKIQKLVLKVKLVPGVKEVGHKLV
jgi:GTP pyrophosphokinase